MVYIIQSNDDQLNMLKVGFARAQETKPECLIVPIIMPRDAAELLEMLLDVPNFTPRCDGDGLPSDAVGALTFAAQRTVHDALDQQENHSMLDVAELSALFDSAAPSQEPGKTRNIKTPFGVVTVDIAKYAVLTGLPLQASGPAHAYTIFTPSVTAPRFTSEHLVLVAIKGTKDTSAELGPISPDSLDFLLPRLEVRAASAFEPGGKTYFTRELQSGWQFLRCAQFSDVIRRYKIGWMHEVTRDENRGGLSFSY